MARKELIVAVRSDVEDVKKGFAEVRSAITDMMAKGGAGTESFVVNAGRAVGGLAQSLGIIGRHIQTLTSAAGAVADIAKGVVSLVMEAGERSRLDEIVKDDTLQRLRSVTQGLVTDLDLLRASAKAMQGEFALTEDQLATVGLAAITLHQRGLGPVSEIFEKITDGLRRGAIESLKDYGIIVEGAKGKQEGFNIALGQLNGLSQEATLAVGNMSDNMQRNLTSLSNAWEGTKNEVGSALGEMIAGMSELDEHQQMVLEMSIEREKRWSAHQAKMAAKRAALAKEERDAQEKQLDLVAKTFLVQGMRTESELRDYVKLGALRQKDLDAHLAKLDVVAKKKSEHWAAESEASQKAQYERDRETAAEEYAYQQRVAHAFEIIGLTETMAQMQQRLTAEIDRTAQSMESIEVPKALNSIEKKLSTLTDEAKNWQEAMVDDGIAAMQGFANAGGEAFGKLIAGQGGAAAAAGEMIKQTIFGLAVEMQARALMQFALGLANSFWNPAAAATHFAAAAAFEVGALAFGAGTLVIGAPSSAGGGAGAGGASTGEGRDTIGGSGGGSSVVNNVYQIGYGFVGSERELKRTLAQMNQDSTDRGDYRPNRVARRA